MCHLIGVMCFFINLEVAGLLPVPFATYGHPVDQVLSIAADMISGGICHENPGFDSSIRVLFNEDGVGMNQRDLLLISGGLIAGVALGIAFPQLRRKLAPIISESGGRAGGILSGLAEMVASQLEKVEDFSAEQKSKGPESA